MLGALVMIPPSSFPSGKLCAYVLFSRFVVFVSVDDCNEAVRALGYPRMHRHRLACLRQELVDAFVE